MAYDLVSAKAPRLAGVALQAAAAVLENPITGALVQGRLLEDAGIGNFRRTPVDETPSVLPDLPRTSTIVPASGAGGAPDMWKLVATAPRPPGHAFESIADYARAYRDRRTTPLEVAEKLVAALRRGDKLEPPLAAMIAWREDDLRAQAEASAARWREGKPRSPLDGVPVAVKDELDQVPYPTTAGTRIIAEVPREDAAAVARLRAAGALLYGKANMVECGIDTLGFNAHYGTPRNPYAVGDRYSGGSSSGPGVAVGSGLGPLAVGADGGGSIRIPAALCGVAGLKATHGRISEKGAYPLCWSVGHVGPLGATVRDVAIGYALMAGPVAGDPGSERQPPPSLDGLGEGVEGLRVGVYEPWFEHADAQVVRACRAAVDGLVARGATRVAIEIPDLELCRVAHAVTILGEMALTMDRLAARRREQAAPVRINLALARALTARDYVHAQRVRTRMSAHFARAFAACDVIATPTTAVTAPRIRPDVAARGESDLEAVSALMRFVFPMNLTGHPGLSVPAGHDGDGLPIGLQLVGRPWEEHVLLRAGEVVEAAVTRKAPRLWYGMLPAAKSAAEAA
jgi:Asp-tRNA(Asn)/Glu-tRNA(Gln) amidotransferase A subunit family amidase